MPKRSSTPPPEDTNETAFRVVRAATEDPDSDLIIIEFLTDMVRDIRAGLRTGEEDEALARRLWTTLEEILIRRQALAADRSDDGLRRWRDARHPAAAELGSRGGKKGGKARAAKLSAERRTEIARQAATQRWKKDGK